MKKTSKKLASILLMVALSASFVVGCGAKEQPKTDAPKDSTTPVQEKKLETITVGASPAPHKEILDAAKEELVKKGYDLKIVEFTDYIQPNTSLDAGDLDANYFQHLPYLENFNVEHKTKIVAADTIHYEPMGIFPGKTTSLDTLKDGAVIAVPNDPSNEARALLLLEAAGLLKMNPTAGLNATVKDIVENPKKITFKEMEAAQLPRVLPEVDLAVINGNYAIQADIKVSAALTTEAKDSEAAKTFGNIIAVKEGNEATAKTKALVEALKSDAVKKFIEEKYQGAVVPMF